MEQFDSQLMMADELGLSRLDARRSEHELLIGNQPCIEQQEIDRPNLLDQRGDGGVDVDRVVQIKLQRREDHGFVLRGELSGHLLGPAKLRPVTMISCQPSLASKRAAALPSPEVAPVTSAIECSMGISVVKVEGRDVVPWDLSMLFAVFICLAVLQTLEYDNRRCNARSFVRYGN